MENCLKNIFSYEQKLKSENISYSKYDFFVDKEKYTSVVVKDVIFQNRLGAKEEEVFNPNGVNTRALEELLMSRFVML